MSPVRNVLLSRDTINLIMKLNNSDIGKIDCGYYDGLHRRSTCPTVRRVSNGVKKIIIVFAVTAFLYSLVSCYQPPVNDINSHQSGQKPSFNQKEMDTIVNLDTLLKRWEKGFANGLEDEQKQTSDKLKDIASRNMSLLERAMSDDEGIKMVATLALGFSQQNEAIPILVTATRDKDLLIRANAVFSLGMLGLKETPTEPLIRMLDDKEPSIRTTAAFALSMVLRSDSDQAVLEPLHRALNDQYPEVRREIIRALTTLARKESLPHLVKSLQDNDETVRINSARALAAIKDKDAIEPLITALNDTAPRVRDALLYALKEITGLDNGNDVTAWQDWWGKQGK